jgi:hypothetical protein
VVDDVKARSGKSRAEFLGGVETGVTRKTKRASGKEGLLVDERKIGGLYEVFNFRIIGLKIVGFPRGRRTYHDIVKKIIAGGYQGEDGWFRRRRYFNRDDFGNRRAFFPDGSTGNGGD